MIYHYIQSFLRNIKRNKFFYTVNLVGFFTGFLLLTLISAFVYQEMSFDRFHINSQNIYRITSGGYGVTPLCFKEKLENKVPEIKDIVRIGGAELEVSVDNEEFNIDKVYYTDPGIFRTFSFKLLAGIPDNTLNAPFSIVLDKSTAGKLFGTSSPLGEIICDKNGTNYTVTGVVEDFPYNSHIQCRAFISIETLRHIEGEDASDCGSWRILTYLRLFEDSDEKEAEKKINELLADSRMADYPLKLEALKKIYHDYDNNKYDGCKHGNLQTTLLYLAVAVLVMLIVVFNYINLSTAISVSRIREFSIRKLVGAEKMQIIRHLLVESVGLVSVSSAMVLFTVTLLLPQLTNVLDIPVSVSLDEISLYGYYFLVVVAIGIVVGLAPGIFLSRIDAMKALNNQSILGTRELQRKLLLVSQLVIVAALLNSTFVVKKQIDFMFKKDLGFQYENVVSFTIDKTLQDKTELLRGQLLAFSGISNVSFSNGLIGDGLTKIPVDDNKALSYIYSIDPEYIDLYHIELKSGRNFSVDMKTDSNSACIINEEAYKAFGLNDPLEKAIAGKEIIGIVKDFNFTSLHNNIEPLILTYGGGNIVQIKIAPDDQEETMSFIENTCKSISPGFECDFTFLDARIREFYRADMNLKKSIGIYSIIAFAIAILGLFGLTLFTVKKRTKEVCIRKLHGARLMDTFKLFAKEQMKMVLIANIISIPLSLVVMNRWLSNFPFKTDIGSFVFIRTFLITAFLDILAASFLIIKVQKTKVVEALKHE